MVASTDSSELPNYKINFLEGMNRAFKFNCRASHCEHKSVKIRKVLSWRKHCDSHVNCAFFVACSKHIAVLSGIEWVGEKKLIINKFLLLHTKIQ